MPLINPEAYIKVANKWLDQIQNTPYIDAVHTSFKYDINHQSIENVRANIRKAQTFHLVAQTQAMPITFDDLNHIFKGEVLNDEDIRSLNVKKGVEAFTEEERREFFQNNEQIINTVMGRATVARRSSDPQTDAPDRKEGVGRGLELQ